ncbi:amidohydrolase [Caulobacter endophyticus]|uniref:Amidohydrolase n=1 Tax=Caulobacter endophyticus TaxID=2172652 RepID=A0A2T9JGT7_9CAUL|nr:amidohydrolase [Caulobacter endophyticus]PVM82920.1 amidohydrolase [Caulobacter endophyticus]
MLDRRQLLGSLGAGLAAPAMAFAAGRTLDVAYVNASIWTGAPGASGRPRALGVIGDRIAAIGAEQVRAMSGKRTRVVDLQGAFVLPGFTDNHTHFLRASQALSAADLRGAASREELVRLIGASAAALRPGAWLQGGNWDHERWGGELPTHAWIDAVTLNTPVAVARQDQHMLLLNALALRLAGITRDTPDPEDGVIVRDARGEPTGVLKDGARRLVKRVIPPASDREVEDALARGAAYALSLGVTQVHNTEIDWVTQEGLRRLRKRGETDLRFYSFVPLVDWRRLADLVAAEGRGDDWVRWGGVKGLVDGSLGSRTALFHDHYVDAPDSTGIVVTKPADLKEWVTGADKAGLQVTVHAIGDAANDEILDIYAEVERTNGKRDRRFRIEHAQHLAPGAIGRFKALDVIASVQPYHAIDDGRWAINRIGAERLKGTYAFRSLLDSGARVTFGSDWPVAPLDPRQGLVAAVLRETIDGANPGGWQPQEKVSIEEALTAYTRTNAYAGFQDDRLGVLAPGFLADFVVMDADLLAIDPAGLPKTKVLRTIVGGKQRFAA